MIYVQLDKDDFIEGWSTSEMNDSIPVKKEKMIEEIRNNFRSYKYIVEDDDFIKDETKVISDTKKQLLVDFNNMLITKNIYGFMVNINGENLRFENTDSNRTFLQKAYSMMESKLINSTTMKFIDKNGNEIPKVVEGATIFEIWILSFMHEDDLNKHFNEVVMPQIENAKTLEELNNITWEGSQV